MIFCRLASFISLAVNFFHKSRIHESSSLLRARISTRSLGSAEGWFGEEGTGEVGERKGSRERREDRKREMVSVPY